MHLCACWRCFFGIKQDPDEREYSSLLAESLEVSVMVHKFPKNVVEVYILVLEDDGGMYGLVASDG
jgi:ribonuclease PH